MGQGERVKLPVRVAALVELSRRRQQQVPAPVEHPVRWLRQVLPEVRIPTAPRHMAVWDWFASLEAEQPARARVEIWPRGGGKSTVAELGVCYCAVTLKRRFVLYVSRTQDLADWHVQTIAGWLERLGVERATNRYKASLSWTAQRLVCANGFGVLAVGLNANVRGARLGQFRPDLIILDDIDHEHDSPVLIQKKIRTLTGAILPAGAPEAAVLFVQNRIHRDSIIAQVADGRADFLLGASITQEPAVWGLEVARDEQGYRILAGTPTWPEGQGLEVCQRQINEWGLTAFLVESQHEDRPSGGLWDLDRDLDPHRVGAAPPLRRIVVGVDPAGSTQTEVGIVVVGVGIDGHFYVLADGSMRGSPQQWARAVAGLYHQFHADAVVVERNYGGDMVTAVLQQVDPRLPVREVSATRGKILRAEPIQALYERGLVHHVGNFPLLELEMCRWQVGQPSPNRLDALVWALTALQTRQEPFRWYEAASSEVHCR